MRSWKSTDRQRETCRDVQIRYDSAPPLDPGNPLIHRVDRGAVGVRLLATGKEAPQEDATRR